MKRIATKLAKRLAILDAQLDRAIVKDKLDQLDRIEADKIAAITEAKKAGLKMAYIQVADGGCIYWEVKRTKTLATFQWLYGGSDIYVSGFGKTVAVPIATANKLVSSFKPSAA